MATAAQLEKQYKVLDALLSDYGLGKTSDIGFWRLMNEHRFGQPHIDWFLKEYHRREDEKDEAKQKARDTARPSYRRPPPVIEHPVIVLSEKWLAKATEVGLARNKFGNDSGYRNRGSRELGKDDNHVAGAIGECAVAKYFKLPWNPNVGVITGTDVGDKLEVRTRRPSSGTDIFFYPDDKADTPYILALINETNQIKLMGWLFGRENTNQTQWYAPGDCWFVPPPYRPIAELVEWLKSNSRAAS